MEGVDNEIYPFKDLPLTPGVAEHLIIELFSGKLESRQRIIDLVVETHQKRGGKNGAAVDVPRTIKRSLENLRERGRASNPGNGYWRVAGVAAIPAPDITNDDIPPVLPLPIAERSIGSGTGSVYVYFFPTYEANAKLIGSVRWLCKIGRSDRDPLLRVLSQAGTALPERPKIALLINSNDPSAMESAIHSTLKLRAQWSASSPGSEWFETNPDEVEEIFNFISHKTGG